MVLWARDAVQARDIATRRENARYLPGIALPQGIDVTSDIARADGAALLVVATPMASLLDVVAAFAHLDRVPLVWLAKGFVAAPGFPANVALAHQAVMPRWGAPVGVISGPSFAEEVARGLPTAVTVAATDVAFARDMASQVRGDTLRAYVSEDLVGVEIGGAVKNVLAIAAGASDGLGFGHNARAALITRGLAETGRLSLALGGARETLMGLAGLGDLVLTCTGDLSRNRRVGLALARGESLRAIIGDLGHVAEGISAAPAVCALARHVGVDMPIASAVDRVLRAEVSVRDAVAALLAREPRAE